MLDGATGKYVVFLDDDNYYCPTYLEKMIKGLNKGIEVAKLNNNPEPKFVICQIVHFGPLPPKWGTPPRLLTGVPPILYNVDTSQILCDRDALLAVNWNQNTGYFFESIYEQLGQKYPYIIVNEVLALHL